MTLAELLQIAQSFLLPLIGWAVVVIRNAAMEALKALREELYRLRIASELASVAAEKHEHLDDERFRDVWDWVRKNGGR